MRQYGSLVGFLVLRMTWAIGLWEAVLAPSVGAVAYLGMRDFKGHLHISDLAGRLNS